MNTKSLESLVSRLESLRSITSGASQRLKTPGFRLQTVFLFLFGLQTCFAADRITTTIAFTNSAGTTNGQTIQIVAGNTTTRTWTNSVTVPASQILTNSSATGAATNLYNHLLATAPLGVAPIVMSGPTNVVLYGQSGIALAVTLSAGYASVSYATQSVTSAYTVRIPNTIESAATKTNVASELVNWLNLSAATNQIAQASPAMAQLLGTTNTQTVTGAKTFTGAVILSNAANIFYRGTISNAASITGNLGLLTNGLLQSPVFNSAKSTNETFYVINPADGTGMVGSRFGSGFIWYDTNGSPVFAFSPSQFTWYTNAEFRGIVSTYGTNAFYGNALGLTNLQISFLTNVTFQGTNWFPAGSDLAFGRYPLTTLADGNNSALPLGTNVFVELSGNSTDAAIAGLTAQPNRDGAHRLLLYQGTATLTILNNSGLDATPGNRILTLTGRDLVSAGPCAVELIYNATTARWIVLNFWSVSGWFNITSLNIANFAGASGQAVSLGDGSILNGDFRNTVNATVQASSGGVISADVATSTTGFLGATAGSRVSVGGEGMNDYSIYAHDSAVIGLYGEAADGLYVRGNLGSLLFGNFSSSKNIKINQTSTDAGLLWLNGSQKTNVTVVSHDSLLAGVLTSNTTNTFNSMIAVLGPGGKVNGMDTNTLFGTMTTGSVSNAAGSRVAYLSDTTNNFAVLSPTSQQTNYLITLQPNGAKYVLYTANTNANLTLTNLAAGYGASIFFNAITSSVNCSITLPSSLLTNYFYNASVTNGQGEWHNYESLDGSSTNITVISGGLQRR